MKHVVNVMATIAVLAWLCAMSLFLHYDATRPTLERPADGRVYPWSNHGHVVYLTQEEQIRLYLLGGGAGGLFVVAFAIWYLTQNRKD